MPATTNILTPGTAPIAGATPQPTGAAAMFAALLAAGATPETAAGEGAVVTFAADENVAPGGEDEGDGKDADATVLLPLLDQQMLMQPQIVPAPPSIAGAAVASQPEAVAADGIAATPNLFVKDPPVSRKLPTPKFLPETSEAPTETPAVEVPTKVALTDRDAPNVSVPEPAGRAPVSRRLPAIDAETAAPADQPVARDGAPTKEAGAQARPVADGGRSAPARPADMRASSTAARVRRAAEETPAIAPQTRPVAPETAAVGVQTRAVTVEVDTDTGMDTAPAPSRSGVLAAGAAAAPDRSDVVATAPVAARPGAAASAPARRDNVARDSAAARARMAGAAVDTLTDPVASAATPMIEAAVVDVATSAVGTAAPLAPMPAKAARGGWMPATIAKPAAPVPDAEPIPAAAPPTLVAPAPQVATMSQTSADPKTPATSVDRQPAEAAPAAAAKPVVTPADVVLPAEALAVAQTSAAKVMPAVNEPIAAPEPAIVSAEEVLAVEANAQQPVRRAATPRPAAAPQPISAAPTSKATPTPLDQVRRAIDPVKVEPAAADSAVAAPLQPAVAQPKLDVPVAAPVQQPVTAALSDKVLDLVKDSQWIDQLARDIASSSGADNVMRFRLSPEQLGALKVEITQGDRGAHVHLQASSEAAQQVLADAAPKLAAEARSQGVRIADTQVSFTGSSGGSDNAAAQQQQDSARQRAQAAQQDAPLRTLRNPTATNISDATARTSRRSDRYA